MKRGRSFYVKLAFCGLFLAVIGRMLLRQKEQLLEHLEDFDPLWLAAALGVSALMMSVSNLKWQILLRQQGHRLPFWDLMKFYLVGYYFTNFLPSNVGGDVVRSWYVGRRIESQGAAAVSVFLERFTGMLLMLVMLMASPLLLPRLYRHPGVWAPALLALGVFAAVIWLWTVKEPFKLPNAVANALFRLPLLGRFEGLYRKLIAAAEKFHAKLIAASKEIAGHRGLWIPVAGLSLLFYGLVLLNVYVSFRVFGFDLSLMKITAIIPSALFVAMLPLSLFASLGLAEWGYMYYFGLEEIGVPAYATLLMALVLRFKFILLGACGLPYYLSHKPEPDVETEAHE